MFGTYVQVAPGCPDEVWNMTQNVKAMGITAAKYDDKVIVNDQSDDSYGAYFNDLATSLAWARLNRYIVSDLCGSRYSYSFGNFTQNIMHVFSMLLNSLGIKTGNIAVIIFVAVVLVILIMILKDPGIMDIEESASNVDESMKYDKVWNRNTIAHSIAVTGVLGGLGIANYWGPSMLTDMGMSSANAGLASTMFTAVGIVSSLIFGGISDRMGKRRPSMLIGGVGMVAGYILMIIGNQGGTSAIVVAGMICTGFCAYVVYPMGFALLSDTTTSSKIGAANGVIQGISFLVGMFVFQQIVGVVKDATDSYWIGLAFCAALTLITNVILVTFFVREKDQVVKEMQKAKAGE